jgi:hypothetical protein
MSERRERHLALSAGLPGMAVFDVDPLTVRHSGAVRRIRLRLNGRQYLHLSRVTILSSPETDLGGATAQMSSILEKSAAPIELLSGKPIHTGRDKGPFWEVRFAASVPIEGIRIYNRPGWRAERASGIIVEFEDEAGQVTTFDNLDEAVVAGRLAEARRTGAALAALARNQAPGAGEFEARWIGLMDLLDRAISGEPIPREDLALGRGRALEAILGLLDGWEGHDLERGLHLAAELILLLMLRSHEADRSPDPMRETRGFAAYVTSLLAKREKKSVHNLELLNFGVHYNRTDRILRLEKDMASLYLRATGDAASLPFMVRVHGISAPFLQMRADDFLAAMEDLQEALTQIGYESMICYGTLLGAVRDSKFIDHDDDVDMAVVLRTGDAPQEMGQVAQRLAEQRFRCRMIRDKGLLRVNVPARKVGLDLFPIIPNEDGTFSMFMEGMRVREVAGELLVPVGRISFLGRTYGAPAQPEGFLADRYGPGWQVPQRKIGHKVPKD